MQVVSTGFGCEFSTGGILGTGGSGTGGGCGAGTHDGGDGTCVAIYACAAGYHNDGTGSCVVKAPCQEDYLPDSTGTCVPMAGVNWIQRGTSRDWAGISCSADERTAVATALGLGGRVSLDSGATWTEVDIDAGDVVSLSGDGRALFFAAGADLYRSVDLAG